MGAINLVWALDHFPYHLTLLKMIMIEALTLTGLEDGIRAEIMIAALTLRGLEDGI